MKITIQIEDAPEGGDVNRALRNLVSRAQNGGLSRLDGITIQTDGRNGTAAIVGEWDLSKPDDYDPDF